MVLAVAQLCMFEQESYYCCMGRHGQFFIRLLASVLHNMLLLLREWLQERKLDCGIPSGCHALKIISDMAYLVLMQS